MKKKEKEEKEIKEKNEIIKTKKRVTEVLSEK